MIRHSWLAGLFGLALAGVWLASAMVPTQPGAVSPPPERKLPAGNYSTGCGAAGCHGGPVEPGYGKAWKSSATVWRTMDRHSRAYHTLITPDSARIADLLGIGLAHESERCLSCHGNANATRPASAEGVGCESCHGSPERWLLPHQTWGNQGKDFDRQGLAWLNDMPDRARACVGCHVGDSTKEVDHDLIAAGHPRLNFEFFTYLRALPPHWDEKVRATGKPVPPEAIPLRAWAAGQSATMEASLALLAKRAGTLEFSEWNCFDCHHGLRGERRTPPAGGKRGRPGWHKAHELKRLTGDAAQPLLDEMSRPVPRPHIVTAGIATARNAMKPPPNDPVKLLSWLKPPDGPMNWDEACWHHHGLAAVEMSRRDAGFPIDPTTNAMFKALRARLELVPPARSPSDQFGSELPALWRSLGGR